MMLRTWVIQMMGGLAIFILMLFGLPKLSPLITERIEKAVNTNLQASGFNWVYATVTDRDVDLLGATRSPEARYAALQTVRDHWLVKNVQDNIEPKPVFPYTMDMQWNGRALTLKGYVPSHEDKTQLLEHIKALFGDNADVSGLALAVGAPDAWMTVNQQLLAKLSTLPLANIHVSNNRIDITGKVSQTHEIQAFNETINTIAGNSFIVESHLLAADYAKQVCSKRFNALLQKEKIRFKSNEAIIDRRSDLLLTRLADNAVLCADSKITIVGFTDNVGEYVENMKLSYERAEAVKARLFHQGGIPLERLKAIGKGASEPIDSNNSAAGRANNRRIEFIVEGVL